jgi:hypothetical protein
MGQVPGTGDAPDAPKARKYDCVSWTTFKYSGPGLKQIGWLATKPAKDIKSSPWSVGCETLDRDYADFNVYRQYVGELGVKRARLQSGWAKCEKVKGVYDFAWLDACVRGVAEQSVKPWVCLCYGNPLYGADIELNARIFTDEATMTAWLKYVETTVTRYKDVVNEWEIWNEPNNKANKGCESYASLLMKTAEVIRKVQPDAVIIGCALAHVPLDYPKGVLDILKANNKLDLLDVISYHPYDRNPDSSYENVEKLREMVRSYSPKIQLFQGENGCPSSLEWGHALNNYQWTEISQAKWLTRRMAGDRLHGLRSSIFTIIDLKYPNMLQSFGLIRANLLNEFIYKRPAYYAVQHVANVFDDSVTSGAELRFTAPARRGEMTGAGFRKENAPIVLIWYKDRVPDGEFKWDAVPLTIEQVNFKDPVYVEMVSGKVYEIDKQDWSNVKANVKFLHLPVWDSVVMIAERSLVPVIAEPGD